MSDDGDTGEGCKPNKFNEGSGNNDHTEKPEPFCCSEITPYKQRQTRYEGEFAGFIKSKGHYPMYVFQVVEQVDMGEVLTTKYYELHHDGITEAAPKSPASKINSFKNFKCKEHNRFFGLNLYSAT